MVVTLLGELLRERERIVENLAPEHRSRSRDRVRDQKRREVGVVVAPLRPVGVRDLLAVLGDDAHVAVRELGTAAECLVEGLQLVRVPVVVLVAERDELRFGGDHV